jgi:DNA uptake protein ComE-like DNA-binding protein
MMKKGLHIHKIRQLIIDYLSFNKTEHRGTVILMILLILLIMARLWIPDGLSEPLPEVVFPEASVMTFLQAVKLAEDSANQAMASRRQQLPGYNRTGNLPFPQRAQQEKAMLLIELNSTDTLELQQLRGIGPGFARRIIAFRDRLGGFFHKRQMLEVFGMDTARYNLISDNLTVNPDSIHKIPLNSVSMKELMRHPYFPYPLARKIMEYRYSQKTFKNLEEVKTATGLSDSLFRRMVVYLRL